MKANDKQVGGEHYKKLASDDGARQCGVYALIFSDGSTYIGASKNMWERYLTHMSWLRHNNGQTKLLQDKYDSLGAPEFKVLEACPTDHVKEVEKKWFRQLNPTLCKFPVGGCAGATYSDEAKRKLSLGALKRTDQMKQSKRQLETWRDPEIIARRMGSAAIKRGTK